MKLIIGLGNPGFRYKKTLHNAGFLAIDYIQKNFGGFSKWKNNRKLQAEISENLEQNIILAKPQTYMNNSGGAVKLLLTDYRLPTTDLFIIHDDFDIPINEFKIEQNRGSAGHKGAQSIIDELGVNNFWRLRIGVRPLSEKADLSTEACQERAKAENFVLKKFTREEKSIFKETLLSAVAELFKIIHNN